MTAHWVPWTLTDELAAASNIHGPEVLFPRQPPERTRMCPICHRYVRTNESRIVVAKRAHHMRCFEVFTEALDARGVQLTAEQYEELLDREGL